MGIIVSGIVFAFLLICIAAYGCLMIRRIESGNWPADIRFGFRTPAMTKSRAAWDAAHRAALPFLKVGSWAALAGGLLLGTAGFLLSGSPGGPLILVMVGIFCWVVPLGILFLGGFKADQVAGSINS